MPDTPLSADPKLSSVFVGPHPDASTPGVWVRSCTRSMLGFTPIDICVLNEVPSEFLPADFWSTTVANDVAFEIGALGHTPIEAIDFPPVAQDTTIWDPETNAPYP